MAKIVLDTITGGYDLSIINNNFNKIEAALQDEVLYRNNPIGEPNTLETNIDANAKRIYNLPEPLLQSEAARLQDVTNALAGGAANLISFTPYGNLAALNVQAAIQEVVDEFVLETDLASTANAKGASLVGIEDSAALYTASNVEAALAEAAKYTQGSAGSVTRTKTDKFQESVSVKDFGAVGDGVADDTAAFLAMAAISARRKYIPAGTYKIANNITFQPNDLVYGDGDATVIDASAATLAAGSAVVSISGTFTQLVATMSSSPAIGAISFTMTSVSEIAQNDVLVLYNPTNSSWSPWRAEYREGEFIRVARISGTTLFTDGPLYSGYTAANMQVFKLGGTGGRFENFRIKTPASQVVGWRIADSVNPTVENVHTVGNTTYAGGEFKRCYGITFTGSAYQSSAAVDDEYGIAVSNSQVGNFLINGNGGRHPISFGGGDYSGCVPCRNFNVYGGHFGNLGPTGSGDLHGNTEDIKFFGVTFANGSDVGGANHKFNQCVFKGNTNSGISIYAGEPVKGTFEFNACTIETTVNPNASSFGMINIGNISANVSGPLRFIFNNCIYAAHASTIFPILVDITGGTNNPDIIINGGLNLSTGATQFVRLQRSAGSGTIALIKVDNIAGLPSTCSYVTNAGAGLTVTKYILPIQQGVISVPTAAAASTYSATVTFTNPYPVAPIVTVSKSAATVGTKRAIVDAVSVASTQFSATVSSCDGANFAGSDTATVYWRAGIS